MAPAVAVGRQALPAGTAQSFVVHSLRCFAMWRPRKLRRVDPGGSQLGGSSGSADVWVPRRLRPSASPSAQDTLVANGTPQSPLSCATTRVKGGKPPCSHTLAARRRVTLQVKRAQAYGVAQEPDAGYLRRRGVSAATAEKYTKSAKQFKTFLARRRTVMPTETVEVDKLLEMFLLHSFFLKGRSLNEAQFAAYGVA